MELKLNAERRAHPRTNMEIAVKLRRSARALFTGGRTHDVSMCGASIELVGPREAQMGERIAIAFEHLQCPVTRAARMIGATVIRADRLIDGHQMIAIRFDSIQQGLEGLTLNQAA